MSDRETYHIEGIMPATGGRSLLALDRPFAGREMDTLVIAGSEPPVRVVVQDIVASADGSTRDIVIAPLLELNDPRMLTGHDLVAENE